MTFATVRLRPLSLMMSTAGQTHKGGFIRDFLSSSTGGMGPTQPTFFPILQNYMVLHLNPCLHSVNGRGETVRRRNRSAVGD
jgi:hypothetical protein